jgi:SAM-dependent methyltransferase
VGNTLQIIAELLVEAADVRAGQRVLDVACGQGNAAIAAAFRFAQATGVDYARPAGAGPEAGRGPERRGDLHRNAMPSSCRSRRPPSTWP